MSIALTETGLEVKSEQEITDDIAARFKARFGSNFDTDPTESITGQITSVVAEWYALAAQAGNSLYRQIDPDAAIGVSLDARVALTGTVRAGETYSQVDVTFTFSAAGSTVDGDLYRHDDTDELWEVVGGPYSVGGAGSVDGVLQAVNHGPKLAAAGSTWTIVTAVANLTSVTNPTDDADPGRFAEEDEDLKRRRQDELYAENIGGLDAIAGLVTRKVNATSGVGTILKARCYHNPATAPVDSDGIPFKAFRLVLEMSPAVPDAATQQAIHDAIWLATGAGGEAWGTDYTGTITDSEGVSQPSAFDVVDLVNIVIEVDLVTSTTESKVSQNIESVVAAAILARATGTEAPDADGNRPPEWEKIGRDVLAMDIVGVITDLQAEGTISGVDGVVVRLAIDPASPSVVTKLSIANDEKSDFDSANITVVQT